MRTSAVLALLALGTAAHAQTGPAGGAYRRLFGGRGEDVRVRPQMASLGAMLKAKGYGVAEFVAPVRSFFELRGALNGAAIVVYWGHGVIRNSRTGCFNPESADVGGFYVDGHDLSPNGLRREVHLAKDAIVLMPNSCYAAGNASMDEGKVRRDVLEARMRNYAQPFMEMGARGVGACLDPQAFLSGILVGKPFEKAYEASAWTGKTVSQRLGAYEFRYRESSGNEGLSTTSALFWRVGA